jgi:prepilin-type N-terminal cleavage/methylation domain-containing protein
MMIINRVACGERSITAGRRSGRSRRDHRSGFTLIEMLVVITIILLVSAVALPTVLPALSHRQVSEAARLLQGVLAGARDAAIRDNAPSGIRLIPDPIFNGLNTTTGLLDPTLPLAYNRIIPIQSAPEYSEGLVTLGTNLSAANFTSVGPLTYPVNYPTTATQYYPFPGLNPAAATSGNVLMVYEQVFTSTGSLNSPTSWFWNIRVGDKIQINNAGPWYTVVGPMAVTEKGGNTEMFVNVGAPGTTSPLQLQQGAPGNLKTVNPDFLFVVNGQDDNSNGWVDEGWDGVDNNNDGHVDELAEWEFEAWLGADANPNVFATDVGYTIQRRPMPTINAREISLPSNVVIDASSWGNTNERTRVPGAAFNQFSGFIDVLLNPDGSVVPTTLYSSPSSLGLGGSFYHFWLAERSDVYAVPVDGTGSPQTLMASLGVTSPSYPFFLPMPLGSNLATSSNGTNSYDLLVAANSTLPILKGEMRLVTLFTRTGQTITNDNPTFDVLNVNQPFIEAQQGVSGEQQ